ncbi:hypothetical protein DC081_03955 [Ignatzschineria cameli]|uniref:Uncharacterized protein n=1 Tax=Ignatzschineria cameli TaxID=2182793 RepID=A0ABX5L1U4_9GAMM|nr:hypothetical protein DC079_04250 [Ignatzschineria cameli]PWD92242.1 hypothetical protein DC081_03955 [Ignatzschineria cameli]PWD93036.1 hypothetical protein DC078_04250 [Ignatzschineria cameli]
MNYLILAVCILLFITYFLWKSRLSLKRENKTIRAENQELKEKHGELLSKVEKIRDIYEETGNATRDELISILHDAGALHRS